MSCIVRNRAGMLQYGAAHYITDQMHVRQATVNSRLWTTVSAVVLVQTEFAQSKIILSFLDEGFGPAEIAATNQHTVANTPW
jgi:hypothetical protein